MCYNKKPKEFKGMDEEIINKDIKNNKNEVDMTSGNLLKKHTIICIYQKIVVPLQRNSVLRH